MIRLSEILSSGGSDNVDKYSIFGSSCNAMGKESKELLILTLACWAFTRFA
jgi:hypothetical protein